MRLSLLKFGRIESLVVKGLYLVPVVNLLKSKNWILFSQPTETSKGYAYAQVTMYDVRDARYVVGASRKLCIWGTYPDIEFEQITVERYEAAYYHQQRQQQQQPSDTDDFVNELFISAVPTVLTYKFILGNNFLKIKTFRFSHNVHVLLTIADQFQTPERGSIFCIWYFWSYL